MNQPQQKIQPKIERVPGTAFICRICKHPVYCQVMIPIIIPTDVSKSIVMLNENNPPPQIVEWRPSLFFCEHCTVHFHAPANFSGNPNDNGGDDGEHANGNTDNPDGQSEERDLLSQDGAVQHVEKGNAGTDN